jgi:hypothetical protein
MGYESSEDENYLRRTGYTASAACAVTVLLFVPFWIHMGKGTVFSNLREDFVAYAVVLLPHLSLAIACALAPGVHAFDLAMALSVVAGLALTVITVGGGILGSLTPTNDIIGFVSIGCILLLAQVVLFIFARAGLRASLRTKETSQSSL